MTRKEKAKESANSYGAYSLVLLLLFSACEQYSEKKNNVEIKKADLVSFSIGSLRLNFVGRLERFTVQGQGDSAYYTAMDPSNLELYKILIQRDSLYVEPICVLPFYERFTSTWTEDCSLLKLDNETGKFSLLRDSVMIDMWDFEKFAPQSLPNSEMIVKDDWVYVSNSSYNHHVGSYIGANQYFNEVKPILKFNLYKPYESIEVIGRFPEQYQTTKENILDFHPAFCIDARGRCILSFAFSDSLIVIDVDGGIDSYLCSSSYYTTPVFPTFKDGQKLSVLRKFQAESNQYMGVHYNHIRKEYYRFLKHETKTSENIDFSVLVLNDNYEVTAEYLFDTSLYAPYPLLATQKGFMLPNIKVSRGNNVLYFESFDI
jgi:hypothetical protein